MSAILTLLSVLSVNAGVAALPTVRAYTAANVTAEIEQHIGFVRACYVAHPPRPDGHGGKRLRLLFRLGADGQVAALVTKHDSLDNTAATECVRRLARTWRFPAPPTDGAQFEYSFRFR